MLESNTPPQILHSDPVESGLMVLNRQINTAFVVVKDGTDLSYNSLKIWCSDRMSSYKIPKKLVVVDTLPRNAMGKVTKPKLSQLIPNS